MSKRNRTMSDALKYEIAKELGITSQIKPASEDYNFETAEELGVYGAGQSLDWGAVSSRDCGNMVKKAIEMAGRNLS